MPVFDWDSVGNRWVTDTLIDCALAPVNNDDLCNKLYCDTAVWTELVPGTSYNQTAPTTSTLTMLEDWTALIVPGCAIRFTLAGVPYYAMCEAIVANLLTIAGAPFTLGAGDVDGLWYSPDPGMVKQLEFFIQGNFADGADNDLLQNDMETYFRHQGATAFVVKISHRVDAADSGVNDSRVNVSAGGNAVGTSNAGAGRAVAAAWTDTVVDIGANYQVDYEEALELMVDNNSTNKDAADLTVSVVLVYE